MLKLLNADDYVPRTIHDIVYHSDRSKEAIEEIVEGYVPFPTAGKNGIILWGVWGTGKTQLAKLIPEAFERRITGQEPWVNFITVKAKGTGLAIVNEIENTKKLNFASFGSYHYFILDEVDLLGKEGMESLKAVMNKPRTIFIMTTNNLAKIERGVLNRSVTVEFNKAPSTAWLPTVRRVLKDAGVEVTDEAAVLEYIDKCDGSARDILMSTFRFIRKMNVQKNAELA